MHRLILFKIVIFVVLQHILAVFGQRPRPTNPCPVDFLRFRNRCYYFSSEDDTWQGAKTKCDDRGSSLVVINNKRQNDALKAFLKMKYTDAKLPNSSRLQIAAPRWLGSQYDWNANEWKWIYNGQTVPPQLFDKVKFQKKELAWHCLTIDPSDKYSWNSDSCFEKNYYICQTQLTHRLIGAANLVHNNKNRLINESPMNNSRNNSSEQHVSDSLPGFLVVTAENSAPIKGTELKKKKNKKKFLCPKKFVLVRRKCYYFSRDEENWAGALTKCQSLSSELAVLKNLQQEKKLQLKINKFRLSNGPRWIGSQYDFKNNVWKWAATGDILTNEPNIPAGSPWTCLLWDPNVTVRWIPERCFSRMPYICERSATPSDKKNANRKKAKSTSHKSY